MNDIHSLLMIWREALFFWRVSFFVEEVWMALRLIYLWEILVTDANKSFSVSFEMQCGVRIWSDIDDSVQF